LGAVLVLLYKASQTSDRISRLETLPLSELAGYSAFSKKMSDSSKELRAKLERAEKNIVATEERLGQIDESVRLLRPDMDADRMRMDELEKLLNALADKLAAQQKSAAEIQKRMVQGQMPIQARSNVTLFSVRSFGSVSAVRLTSKAGEISPLMRAGDQWHGWRFLRLDGTGAVFSVHGKEQALVL
jgi:predicted nuclease with TOPRIM domain